MIDSFVKADIIDMIYYRNNTYYFQGNGRKLFLENNPKIDLSLFRNIEFEDGIVVMKYSKRNK